MLGVSNLSDGRHANHRHLANFARRHSQLCMIALFSDDLCKTTCGADHLAAFSGTQLNVMNLCTERDILDRQRVSRQNIGFFAAQDHRSDRQSERCENVTLFAIEIIDQGDVCRAVRVVLKLSDLARNTGFVTLEIDDPVMTLMASAAASDRDPAVVVVPGNFSFSARAVIFRGTAPL